MSYEEVLANMGTRRKLVETIRKRQLQSLGHILRKEELEDVAKTGKIDGCYRWLLWIEVERTPACA